MADGTQLVVLVAAPHHSGHYKCVARNPVGIEQINFYVAVHGELILFLFYLSTPNISSRKACFDD